MTSPAARPPLQPPELEAALVLLRRASHHWPARLADCTPAQLSIVRSRAWQARHQIARAAAGRPFRQLAIEEEPAA